MNRAIRITAVTLGATAGLASIEHGVFEWMQGNMAPDGLFISSIGPPCVPEQVWNSCEPAFTIVPNFAWTGVLAMLFGTLTIVWSIWLLHRPRGPLGLALLSIPMFLFGGGIFPPVFAVIAGLTALRINRPLTAAAAEESGLRQFLARFYPFALILALFLLLAQWVVGYFFNDFMMQVMVVNLGVILGSIFLAIISANAHDALVARKQRPPRLAS